MNGQRAVFIGVNATPTGNPLEIVKGVREMLPTIQRGLPPTVEAQVVYDSTGFIDPRSTRSSARWSRRWAS